MLEVVADPVCKEPGPYSNGLVTWGAVTME
jgi:hypothetical protein